MYQITTDYIVDLNKIYEKNCNAVILQRTFPSLKNIEFDIGNLPESFWEQNQCHHFTTSSANEIFKTLKASFDYEMLQRTSAELITDITDVFAHFKDLFKTDKVNFRCEKIITDSCKLFHTDMVNVRLFVTYYGYGTEFINEANISPSGKIPWDGKMDAREKNDKLMIDNRKVMRIFPGDLILMKGNKWADKSNNFSPLYHKSPDISYANPCRFIVSMDY